LKILTILGARPQFIKAGSVSREILKYNDINEIIVHTGQHYDSNMSDIFFEEMKIPKPNYFLGIGGKSHGAMTGQMIEKIEEVTLKENPDWIMVYGDTNSTLAGAIVASKLHIKLAHIEAGLRSFNMDMPEEINRILTDRVSNILFCPTNISIENLKREGFENFNCNIVHSGDVMKDGMSFYKKFAIKPKYDIKNDYILCTIHRAENTDDKDKFKNIFTALNKIGENRQVILPLHPRTKKALEELELNTKNIAIIDPVGYLEMVWLVNNCSFVITDSGGLQKESFFCSKNALIIRDSTEWYELIEYKYNKLVKADCKNILNAIGEINTLNKDFNKNIFGIENSSKIILNSMKNYKG